MHVRLLVAAVVAALALPLSGAARPTDKGRVLVHGSYQSGIGVLDFTDPANAPEIAYADPAPLVPTTLGGDWSSYWYDGFIYESTSRAGCSYGT